MLIVRGVARILPWGTREDPKTDFIGPNQNMLYEDIVDF